MTQIASQRYYHLLVSPTGNHPGSASARQGRASGPPTSGDIKDGQTKYPFPDLGDTALPGVTDLPGRTNTGCSGMIRASPPLGRGVTLRRQPSARRASGQELQAREPRFRCGDETVLACSSSAVTTGLGTPTLRARFPLCMIAFRHWVEPTWSYTIRVNRRLHV